MAVARLRRAFRYPEEDETEGSREELDEQEQEAVIEKLRLEDRRRNELYTKLFAVLPIVLIFPFIPLVFNIRTAIISILGITSLLATSYTLLSIPIQKPDPKGKKPLRDIKAFQTDESPLKKYLPSLNAGLCSFLGLAAWRLKDQPGIGETVWILCLLPGAMYITVMSARKIMYTVDIDELERLKYEYKGA